MLGVVLIYVGVVLILNGIGRLCNIDAKSTAVFIYMQHRYDSNRQCNV